MVGGRDFGETGHAHHFTGNGYDKACTSTDLDILNPKGIIGRGAEELRVVRKGFLGFGHAYQKVTTQRRFEIGQLVGGFGAQKDLRGAIKAGGQGVDFVGKGRIRFVEKTGRGWWALEAVHDGMGQGFGSLASQGPGVADDGVYAPPPAMLLDDADLLVGIGTKAVQRHHRHQAKKRSIGDVFL